IEQPAVGRRGRRGWHFSDSKALSSLRLTSKDFWILDAALLGVCTSSLCSRASAREVPNAASISGPNQSVIANGCFQPATFLGGRSRDNILPKVAVDAKCLRWGRAPRNHEAQR